MTKAKETQWKHWGILYAINLSKQDVTPNYPLIFSFLSFWSTIINAFIFPFGAMTITLHDVALILGLSIAGLELPSSHATVGENLDIAFSRASNNYSHLIIAEEIKCNDFR